MRTVPRYAYVLALFAALMAFVLFAVVRLHFHRASRLPLVLAILLSLPLATLFALVWPAGSWRWGLWVSGGFSVFLTIVFVSFAAESQLEWRPALEAGSIAGLSCLGALAGGRLSRRPHGQT